MKNRIIYLIHGIFYFVQNDLMADTDLTKSVVIHAASYVSTHQQGIRLRMEEEVSLPCFTFLQKEWRCHKLLSEIIFLFSSRTLCYKNSASKLASVTKALENHSFCVNEDMPTPYDLFG